MGSELETSSREGPQERWITRLRLIPERCREFSVSPKRAELEFGVDDALARELIRMGMPHARANGTDRFAAVDLHYVGLRLGCAERYLEAMRRWSQALAAATMHEWTEVDVRCVCYVAPGTGVSVLGPDGRRASVVGRDRVAMSFGTAVSGRWPALDPSLDDLLSSIGSLDFCWIPRSLSADFSRATGLADCESAAALLVEECRRRGVTARTAYGLLLSSPYSTPHTWAEVHNGDGWTPVDPLLIGLLVEYGDLDRDTWPPRRSPGPIFLRLADRSTPIVLSGARPVEATYLTSLSVAEHSATHTG